MSPSSFSGHVGRLATCVSYYFYFTTTTSTATTYTTTTVIVVARLVGFDGLVEP